MNRRKLQEGTSDSISTINKMVNKSVLAQRKILPEKNKYNEIFDEGNNSNNQDKIINENVIANTVGKAKSPKTFNTTILDLDVSNYGDLSASISSSSKFYSSFSYSPSSSPLVTVLLPVCNEVGVINQLLSSVTSIDYSNFEVLLLDDSNNENSSIIKDIVQNYPKVKYLRRENRNGFKAGNLQFGLENSQGEFIVIFDADNMPSCDFIERSLQYFIDNANENENKNGNHNDNVNKSESNLESNTNTNLKTNSKSEEQYNNISSDNNLNKEHSIKVLSKEKVGFLQTRIIFRNKSKNFVTRFLSLETSHKDSITSNQNNSNDLASLTGTSCVWRKSCLDDIGSFSSKTLTEDVDLCYRAQISGWNFIYAEDIITTEELPDTISGLRVQRHRWAYGLIRNAFLHGAKILFANNFSIRKKFNALMTLSQSFLLASFIVILFLSLPLVFLSNYLGIVFHVSCGTFLVTSIIWGYNSISSGKNRDCLDITRSDIPKTDSVKTLSITSSDLKIANNTNIQIEQCNNKNLNNKSHTSIFEYLGYVFMYLPLSLYYFIALLENLLGLKVSFVPTHKKGNFTNNSNNSLTNNSDSQPLSKASEFAVIKSSANKILLIAELFCLIYSLAVTVLSIYFVNGWTLLYGIICLCGFLLVLSLSIIEHRNNNN